MSVSVSLFYGVSISPGHFSYKAILEEEQYWFYLIFNWKNKGVHTFPIIVSQKVNLIARLKFELAFDGITVQRFIHYTMEILPLISPFTKINIERYKCNYAFFDCNRNKK